MKIYTKKGDQGKTSLFGGTRVSKYSIRIETYGTVDELNAHLGLLRSLDIPDSCKSQLIQIQQDLFRMGSEFATEPEKAVLKNGKQRLKISKIDHKNIQYLEEKIDEMTATLPPLRNFLLPGGHQAVAECHIARTICRRAERIATRLYEEEPFNDSLLQYLNRLSDYLFTLSRTAAHELKIEEIPIKLD